MKQPSAIIFIHGGDGHNSYEEYLAYIAQWHRSLLPYTGERKRWKTEIFEHAMAAGITCYSPELPSKLNAKYHEWKLVFEILMANIDDNAIFIGHSLWGNFLAKYFSESKRVARSIHLVAPSFGNPGGFDLPGSLLALESASKDIHIWHSSDDSVVNPEDYELYKESIPSIQSHEFHDRGHINQESFPELLEVITTSF